MLRTQKTNKHNFCWFPTHIFRKVKLITADQQGLSNKDEK